MEIEHSKTPLRVAVLIDGERYGRGVSATKNGPFIDELERRVELCGVGNMMLQGIPRLVCLIASWRPHPQEWRAHYRANPITFWMRSRRSRRLVAHLPTQPDVILQIGALSRPAARGSHPYALYLDFTYALTRREWPARSPMGPLEQRLWRWLERRTYADAVAIFCRGAHVARSLREDYGIADENIYVIGAGVNIPLPDLHNTPARTAPRALFIGSDFERKGGEVLLQAWPEVRRHIPDACLMVFGRPTCTMPDGVDVQTVAWDRESIWRALSETSLFVMPAHCETWGDVFLEAMAYGIPCIGAAGDAMPEIIEDGRTGFVIPRGDAVSLAERIVKLFGDPDLRREMGIAGRARVEQRFQWGPIVQRLATELEQAVGPVKDRRALQSTGEPLAKQRLRVLQVIDSLSLGGAEQLLVTLARYIDRSHYDLRVCSLAPIREGPISSQLRALGIPVYSLDKARLRNVRHIAELATLVRKHRIDVLHTHLSDANIIGAAAGALTRRPVVATLHTPRDVYPRYGAVKQALQNFALRFGARVIIACAPEVRTEALDRLHLPASKLIDVPNGIDIRAFAELDPVVVNDRRRELLGAGEGPLVLTVGNMRAAKGHEHLVAAIRLAVERLPGLMVVIVGEGRSYEAVVRERISALGLEDRVLLAGRRQDIPELLAAADLFVLPSVREGLPLALLEAMAAGKPVVATAVGGVPRVVEDGVTGRLVPPADAAALAEALVGVLAQPELARRLAQAGQQRVRQTYGAAAWSRALQGIYSSAALER